MNDISKITALVCLIIYAIGFITVITLAIIESAKNRRAKNDVTN